MNSSSAQAIGTSCGFGAFSSADAHREVCTSSRDWAVEAPDRCMSSSRPVGRPGLFDFDDFDVVLFCFWMRRDDGHQLELRREALVRVTRRVQL